jgi:hypothetical protein
LRDWVLLYIVKLARAWGLFCGLNPKSRTVPAQAFGLCESPSLSPTRPSPTENCVSIFFLKMERI